MHPVLRVQGWQVPDTADGYLRACSLLSAGSRRFRDGRLATEILWFGPQAKQFMKGAGDGMPRAQGFRYVCSDSYRRQAVQSYSG